MQLCERMNSEQMQYEDEFDCPRKSLVLRDLGRFAVLALALCLLALVAYVGRDFLLPALQAAYREPPWIDPPMWLSTPLGSGSIVPWCQHSCVQVPRRIETTSSL